MKVSIPGYNIISEIGRGETSSVYYAKQARLGRDVALKYIDAQLVDDQYVRSLLIAREARVLSRLVHPRIASVFDIDSFGEFTFFTMEYLRGETLHTRIRHRPSCTEAVEIVAALADVLAFIHQAQFVHGDIKPDNILLREDSRPALIDFGNARALTEDKKIELPQTNLPMGDKRYMSPEQGRDQNIDERSDLYSLGVVLYEMLAGHLPWIDNSASMLVESQPSQYRVPLLPAPISQFQIVIDRLLTENPDDRYSSATDFAKNLREIAGLPNNMHPLVPS